MPQQQAPAVGTVMDGYRFKGGDPAQETSWEQVAPIDVSAQYGAGARQLPNGVIERVGPRGGVQRIGGGAGSQGGASPMVGADARARFMINLGPLQESQRILERMDLHGYDPSSVRNAGAAALEAIPFDGGFAARLAGGDEYNAYTQAAKTFEAAIMPIMSGAAVTPSEAQRLIRAALPQPGDSPEVLQQKALQRRQMINAVAAGIGEPEPFGDPLKSELPAVAENGVLDSREIIDRDGQYFYSVGLTPGQDAPPELVARFGQDGQITQEEMMAAGWRSDPETGTWLLPVGNPTGGPTGGGGGAGGGAGRIQSDPNLQAEIEANDGVPDLWRRVEAFATGAAEQIPFLDEAAAWTAAKLSGRDYGEARAVQRDVADFDRQNYQAERNAGGVSGAGATMLTPVGTPIRVARGGGVAANVANRALGGAVGGALYGAGQGEGGIVDRADEAAGGAVIGGVAGVAAPVVARAAAPVIRPVVEGVQAGGRALARPLVNALGERAPQAVRNAVARPNALLTGLDRFASRSPQRVNALQDAAVGLREQGIEPTFVDAINDGGRGTLRALSTRQTPARDAAREFAEGRAEALPSRLSVQSRRIVSPEARPVEDIVAELQAQRAGQARVQYAEPYAQPVQIDPETAAALSGAPGRAAIQRARAAAEAFQDATGVAELDALAAGQTQEVSAATLDRIRQAMSGRAEQLARQPGTRAVGAGLGQRAGQVDQALEGVEGLAPAREAYRLASQQIEAAQQGGRFMQAAPDEFVSSVQGLSPEQMQPVRSAIARNIEISARTPGGAPGVARRLYADPETRRMAEAALGQDAGRLADAARAEAQIVRNAADINPRAGSPTSLNQQDALGAAGEVVGAARDLGTGNIAGLANRAISAIRSRGFSDAEAEALVRAAIDPARTDEVIGTLSERMSRREARNLTRALRYQLTTGPQGTRD